MKNENKISENKNHHIIAFLRKKFPYLSVFINSYTTWGILLILISVIISLYNTSEIFIINVIQNVISSIGVAVLIGAIFDFSKNTEAFTNFVSGILKKIVVSKDFLNEMNENEKKNSLELILKPTDAQCEQCSSINLYYKKSIDNFMELYHKPFKTNFILNIEAKHQDKKIIVTGQATQRIYKVNGRYNPIISTFEREHSKILKSYIILPNGKKIELEESNVIELSKEEIEENEISMKYETNIPQEYQHFEYLTLCREIYEGGFDHWTNFHWLSLTPCDGVYFTLQCRENITIKDHLIFDNSQNYDIVLSKDRKSLTIISTNWLETYTGFTITVSDT